MKLLNNILNNLLIIYTQRNNYYVIFIFSHQIFQLFLFSLLLISIASSDLESIQKNDLSHIYRVK